MRIKGMMLLILILFTKTGSAQYGIIKGYVFDNASKRPIIGANIIMFGTNDRAFSDTSGFFEIRNLNYGKYSFGITLIGYKDTIVNVVVDPGKDFNLKLYLSVCKYHILGNPKTCPICRKTDNVIPILYGLATKKMKKKEKKELVLLGGVRTGCDPLYYCKKDKVKF